MFTGRVVNWQTVLSFFKRLEVLELRDDGVLVVEIHALDNGRIYELVSERNEAYANINESYQNRLWANKPDTIGNSFCIEKSSWIASLEEDPVFSDLIKDAESPIRHFVLATMDDVIHILSFDEPTVREKPGRVQ